jgi:hypothetical protein
MKKLIGYGSSLGLVALLTGCVSGMGPNGGTFGMVYTDVSGPISAGSYVGGSKVGEASQTAIVCVSTGDSSIKAACAAGGITKISHVDYHTMSVMNVYAKTTVTVYGD